MEAATAPTRIHGLGDLTHHLERLVGVLWGFQEDTPDSPLIDAEKDEITGAGIAVLYAAVPLAEDVADTARRLLGETNHMAVVQCMYLARMLRYTLGFIARHPEEVGADGSEGEAVAALYNCVKFQLDGIRQLEEVQDSEVAA